MFTVSEQTQRHVQQLLKEMLVLAPELIRECHDMSQKINKQFADDPDNPLMHQPLWHQFGIATHSRRFQEYLEHTVPDYLQEWAVAEPVWAYFKQQVDGMTRWELFQLVAAVHDIGKFTAREVWDEPDGSIGRRFWGHEKDSGELLRGRARFLLEDLGLTDTQIEYIATCAEQHFGLDPIRQAAKPHYTIAFTRTPEFQRSVKEVLDKYPDTSLEVILCFLPDSLSKTDVAAKAATDTEILLQQDELRRIIAAKNLPSTLIGAALQQPVNIAVAREAIRVWAGRS